MKKKAKKYIFGKKLQDTNVIVADLKTEFDFNLPAIASVLDGINLAIIQDQELYNNEGLFDLYINNEIIIKDAEVLDYTLIYYSLPITSFLTSTNYTLPYHPTPRPLSGSDQVRIRFHGSYWTNNPGFAKPPTIYVHFHYQPKQ